MLQTTNQLSIKTPTDLFCVMFKEQLCLHISFGAVELHQYTYPKNKVFLRIWAFFAEFISLDN